MVFATYVHSEDGAVHLFHQLRCGPLDASRATATITAMGKAWRRWTGGNRLPRGHGLDRVLGVVVGVGVVVVDGALRPLLLFGPDGAVRQQLGQPERGRGPGDATALLIAETGLESTRRAAMGVRCAGVGWVSW